MYALEWSGPNPEDCIVYQKVAYSYDRTDTTITTASRVNHSILQAMPDIEKLLKQATKVTYRMTNASHKGTHLFFYIAPRFSTDYLVLEANIVSDSDIRLALNWVPYVPGTRTIDFSSMLNVKAKSKIPAWAGIYCKQLAKQMANTMPHIEKIARRYTVA